MFQVRWLEFLGKDYQNVVWVDDLLFDWVYCDVIIFMKGVLFYDDVVFMFYMVQFKFLVVVGE